MSLDVSTLYLVATMVAAMLGTMLLFFGRQENIAALKWLGTAYLLGAVWGVALTASLWATKPLIKASRSSPSGKPLLATTP